MEFSLEVDISGALAQIDRIDAAVIQANNMAIREAAAVGLAALRANLSYAGHPAPAGKLGIRTGRLLSQVQPKYFTARNGMLGVALKVIGDRAFVMRINESGAKSHGGRRRRNVDQTRRRKIKAGGRGDRGPLPARHVFATTFKLMESIIARMYLQSFQSHFNSAMPSTAL